MRTLRFVFLCAPTVSMPLAIGCGAGPTAARRDVGRLEVEARPGDVRSVVAAKLGGEYRLRILRPSSAEERTVRWKLPSVVTVSWVAVEQGMHSVVCEPLGAASPSGCELTVAETSDPDASKHEAELRNGYGLLAQWSAESLSAAERVFRTVLTEAEGGIQMDARLALAHSLGLQGKPESALALLQEVVASSRSSAGDRRRAAALAQIIQCLDTTGAADDEENAARTLLAETEGQSFPFGRADATFGLANVLYLRSRFREAQTFYADALDQYGSAGNLEGVIDARLGIAYALMDQGRDADAKLHLERALEDSRILAERRQEAVSLRVLGLAHSKLGENAAAIRNLELAEELFENAKDEASLVALNNSLAEVHVRVNDWTSSLDYYRKASRLGQHTGFALGETVALLGEGSSLHLLGRDEEALKTYERARLLAVQMGHQAMEGAAYAGIGNIFADRKDLPKAVTHLEKAVSMNVAAGNAGQASVFLNDLTDTYLSMDRLDDAAASADRALSLSQESAEAIQTARALAHLAETLRRRGRLEEARQLLERALDVDETMRARVPGADLRAFAFQGAQSRYESYVSLLMQISKERDEPDATRLALEAVERSRSRALLDAVRDSEGRSDTEQDPANQSREGQLLDDLRALALEADHGLDSPSVNESIAERLAQLRRLRGLSAPTVPARSGEPLSALPADAIEASFAGRKALLLEYFLGEKQSYLWAVGGGRFEVTELAPEKELERRVDRVLSFLTARQQRSSEPLRVQAEKNQSSDGLFYREALALSRELLGSVRNLDGFERLVIVSDGALNSLPVGVLPHPQRSGGDGDTYVPLLATHVVLRTPSVTTMVALDTRARDRKSRDREKKESTVVFADPVYTPDDPRVAATHRAPDTMLADELSLMSPNLRGSGRALDSLPRLLASREELRAISAIVPRGAVAVTDFQADRDTAERFLEERHRVVHFATHGILNDRYPELSGIVLSLIDERGNPRDGFLRVSDIYSLHLQSDLIVLSACETALGHSLRGEGITGLVSSFLRTGASGVVASNWKVEDVATRQLMEEFYRGLFAAGLDPAAALRAAQLSLWKRRRTHTPFYWGAFELHGIS